MPLYPDMQKFCGVAILNSVTGRVKYYQWLVLFLGLCDVVYIFTHLLLPVVKYLRLIGWEGVIYIDDSGTLGRDFFQCLCWKFFARDVMGRAGWIVNVIKDLLLGAQYDMVNLKIRIPVQKIEEIKTH